MMQIEIDFETYVDRKYGHALDHMTEFEQSIFDRSVECYKNKHGEHKSGNDFYYKIEIHKTAVWDEFWEKYLNSEEELL